MRQLIVIAAIAAGCSAGRRTIDVPSPAPGARSLLVLYSDAAEVRVRAAVDGASPVRLPALPPGRRYTLRQLRGKAAAGARVSGPAPAVTRAGLRGVEVVASRGERRVSGVIADVSPSDVRVQTAGGVETLPLPVELELARSPGGGTVELRPRPGATGELEVSSWIDSLRWQVGYTAVVDGRRARLQGWLSLTNRGDRPIEVDDVAVAMASPPGGDTSAHRIGRPLALPAGATVELPLIAPGDVPAAIVEVHDPIGDRLDHEGRRPVSRPGYGTGPGAREAPLAIALSIDRRHLGALPAGTISVYRRRRGALVAAGSGDGFAAPAPSAEPLELAAPKPPHAGDKIVIGRSRRVTGRRWQEELAHDPIRRRLLEEIRVELANSGDRAVVVDVREHLYRGLNWAIVYHNQAGRLAKTGSQEVRFEVEVPAGSTRLVAYRVAYTW